MTKDHMRDQITKVIEVATGIAQIALHRNIGDDIKKLQAAKNSSEIISNCSTAWKDLGGKGGK